MCYNNVNMFQKKVFKNKKTMFRKNHIAGFPASMPGGWAAILAMVCLVLPVTSATAVESGNNGELNACERRGGGDVLSGNDAAVEMSVRPLIEFPVVQSGKTLKFRLSFRDTAGMSRNLSYRIRKENLSGEEMQIMAEKQIGNPESVAESGWVELVEEFSLPAKDARLSFELMMNGEIERKKRISIISASTRLEGVELDSADNLVDKNGDLVILVTGRDTPTYPSALSSMRPELSVIRILVLDTLQKHSAEGAIGPLYADILESKLEATYKPLKFDVTTIPAPEGHLLERFLGIIELVNMHEHEVLMKAGQLDESTRMPQPDDFEHYLTAVTEQIRASADSMLIMVTSPPLEGRLHSSRAFARIAKRTAFRNAIAVADPFSRFMMCNNPARYFDNRYGDRPLLNVTGHKFIADEVFTAFKRNFGDQFNAAVRDVLDGEDSYYVAITPGSGQGKIYGEDDPEEFKFAHSPLEEGDSLVGALRRESGEDVGKYAFTLEDMRISYRCNLVLAEDSPSFEIEPRPVTITPEAGQSKAYGGFDPELEFTHTPLARGDRLEGSIGRESGEDVGIYSFTLGDLDAGDNYVLELDAESPVFEIEPRPVTITPEAGQGKLYGEDDPELEFTHTPLARGNEIGGTLGRESGEDVGIYSFTLGGLDVGDNYVLELDAESPVFEIEPEFDDYPDIE